MHIIKVCCEVLYWQLIYFMINGTQVPVPWDDHTQEYEDILCEEVGYRDIDVIHQDKDDPLVHISVSTNAI